MLRRLTQNACTSVGRFLGREDPFSGGRFILHACTQVIGGKLIEENVAPTLWRREVLRWWRK